MEVRLNLRFSREPVTVPLARQLIGAALSAAGVTEDCRADIQLALAEACGNVITHAGPADQYTVTVCFDTDRCTVEIADGGPGVPPDVLTRPVARATDESGRGLHVIRMLADRVELCSDQRGTVLRFVKRLRWKPGSPGHRLTAVPDHCGV